MLFNVSSFLHWQDWNFRRLFPSTILMKRFVQQCWSSLGPSGSSINSYYSQAWKAAFRWPEVQDAQCWRVGSRGLWILCLQCFWRKIGRVFLNFFSCLMLQLQDVTVDEFIDVIDGNRKYCKCGSACRDVISCFLISFHVSTFGKFYATSRHLCVQQAPWHISWRIALLEIMQKRLVFPSLYLLLSPFVLWLLFPVVLRFALFPFSNIKLSRIRNTLLNHTSKTLRATCNPLASTTYNHIAWAGFWLTLGVTPDGVAARVAPTKDRFAEAGRCRWAGQKTTVSGCFSFLAVPLASHFPLRKAFWKLLVSYQGSEQMELRSSTAAMQCMQHSESSSKHRWTEILSKWHILAKGIWTGHAETRGLSLAQIVGWDGNCQEIHARLNMLTYSQHMTK